MDDNFDIQLFVLMYYIGHFKNISNLKSILKYFQKIFSAFQTVNGTYLNWT